MLIATAALAATLALTVAASYRLIAQQQRAHARREDLLLNQLLHATGKPWLPAPADDKPGPPVAPWEPTDTRYVANIERFPTSYAE